MNENVVWTSKYAYENVVMVDKRRCNGEGTQRNKIVYS